MTKSSRKIVLIFALIMPTVGYQICKDIFKNGIKDGKKTHIKQAAHQQK